ncbi:MAG: arabinosyltransferase domain-containing protein [Lawsonella clevelandensis]
MGIFSDLPLDTPQAAVQNMKITVHIDTRFTTEPSLVKLLAMIFGVLCMILSWIALARIDAIVQPTPFAPTGYIRADGTIRSHWRSFAALDAVVYALLIIWHFIGANTSDDGYIHTMASSQPRRRLHGQLLPLVRRHRIPLRLPLLRHPARLRRRQPHQPLRAASRLICAIITWMLISKAIIPPR